jgi:hypothetical protein
MQPLKETVYSLFPVVIDQKRCPDGETGIDPSLEMHRAACQDYPE